MRIALVRHGQTDWNITWRLQGHADNDLNDTGREQARVAASLLADQHWDLAVSSTLKRAIETADIIANILQVPRGEHDPMLVERAYGEAEGLTKEEAVEKFGTDWPGQEAYEDLEARAVAGIDGVARRHPGKDLIIVAHGTFIRAFADATTGLETLTPSNAHSLRLEGEPGNWTITDGLLLQQ